MRLLSAVVAVSLLIALVCTAHALDNGLARRPPMGWNTWCTGGKCGLDICDAKEVRAIADAMATNGMQAMGYRYINLDDCWADHRDASGEIVADESRFPGGLKPLIDYLHARGFLFGLYTDAGEYTCSTGQRLHKIPGSYGHYEQDAQTYAAWGVDYVKMDWCNTNINGTQLDPRVQYPQMSKALNATGRPILFHMCEWGVDQPWEWAGKYANAWRTTGDHHDNWASTSAIIEANAALAKYSGPGAWNDLDFLMTGGQGCEVLPLDHCPGQTADEYRTEFALWCMLASPLIVATDVRRINALQTSVLLNKELVAVNQDPLGVQAQRIGVSNETSTLQIWARPLSDGSQAVALYNAGATNATMLVTAAQVGWAGSTIAVRDLWAGQDRGTFTDSFVARVCTHCTNVYKFSKR